MGVPVVTLAGRAHASPRRREPAGARRRASSLIARQPRSLRQRRGGAGRRAGDGCRRCALGDGCRRAHACDRHLRWRGVRALLHRCLAPRLAHPHRYSRAQAVRARYRQGRDHGADARGNRCAWWCPTPWDEITPYVLAEQRDWFEDEIDFVRAALVRGDRAVDIGANHGVYALAIAQRVGRLHQALLGVRNWRRRRGAPARELADQRAAAGRGRRGGDVERSRRQRHARGRRAQRAWPPAAGAGPGRRVSTPARLSSLVTLDGCRTRLGLRQTSKNGRQDRRRGCRSRDHRRRPPLLRRGVAAGDVRGAARRGAHRHRARGPLRAARLPRLPTRARYRAAGAVRRCAPARSLHTEPLRLPRRSRAAAGATRAARARFRPGEREQTTPARRGDGSTCARSCSRRRCGRAGRAGSPPRRPRRPRIAAMRARSITTRSPGRSPRRRRGGSPRSSARSS